MASGTTPMINDETDDDTMTRTMTIDIDLSP